MIESIFQQVSGSREDFIDVDVYVTNSSNILQMNAAWTAFFPAGYDLPVRVVISNMFFIRPTQASASVGMKVIGRFPTHYCPSTMIRYNISEVYGAKRVACEIWVLKVNNFIWVGGTFGTTQANNAISINITDLFQQYQQALINFEFIANRRGGDRNDLILLETRYTTALSGYVPLTKAVASF